MAISRKSKMASKIKDGRQNLKFNVVTSMTPTRLKLKIWHQSYSKLLVYGHLKKNPRWLPKTKMATNIWHQSDSKLLKYGNFYENQRWLPKSKMDAKVWKFSVVSNLWPLPGLSLKFGTNLIQNYWYMAISRKSKMASKHQDGYKN